MVERCSSGVAILVLTAAIVVDDASILILTRVEISGLMVVFSVSEDSTVDMAGTNVVVTGSFVEVIGIVAVVG